ncbi:unnamed protein product [Prorocentrum cordatum]|uniref:Uncharacterized protein n=1 Tax=Prorocentrum cordatum TaxID=2364126 RepID=A0ABN9Y0C6_9DINO|nr:unnamed protein product [Polarella glacialis]
MELNRELKMINGAPIRESLVDTKLLGKPDKFSGELDENAKYRDGVTWENWSFVLSAYCMADKGQGIVKSVAAGEGLEAWRLLYDEFEPKVPSRFSGMLDAIMYPTMQEHDPIKSIVSWETMVQKYEEQTAEKVMESIKKSVISTRLVPQKLREHLMLNATRFTA